MALSLYRKYRPNVFSDVVGQEHVERTLVNAVTEGNVAHAYLFCGPRGTGKTTTARLLAKALLCESGPNSQPDGTCGQCVDIAQGTHPDVYELDAASRTGVENVREEIIGRVNFAPTRGRSKVYIVDEVHMLSTAAFNALLKTLEEPPEHVVFVLCTTDPQKVPETIQSRCQRFDFKRFSIEQIVQYLERICEGEGFSYEREALEYIAAKSNGGMRDATTALEQMAVYSAGAINLENTAGLFGQMDACGLFEFAGAIAAHDTATCFKKVALLVENGMDLSQFAQDLASHMRDLYVTELTGGGDGLVACLPGELEAYRAQAHQFGAERLSRALQVCADLVGELRHSVDARLSTEVACTRLCRAQSDLSLEALSERIVELERNGAAGSTAQTAQPVHAEPAGAFGVSGAEPYAAASPEEDVPCERPMERAHPASGGLDSGWQSAAGTVQHEEPQPSTYGAHAEAASHMQPAQQEAAADEHLERLANTDSAAEPAGVQRPAMSTARILQAVLTEVKREDVSVSALLNGVSLEESADGYTLLFPEQADFAVSLVRSGKNQQIVEAAFDHVVGRHVHVGFQVGSAQAGRPEVSETAFDAGAEAAFDDAGYLDAVDSAAGYYDEVPAASEVFESFGEDEFADSFSQSRRAVDEKTAAEFADVLSAFGSGIKLEEIE